MSNKDTVNMTINVYVKHLVCGRLMLSYYTYCKGSQNLEIALSKGITSSLFAYVDIN